MIWLWVGVAGAVVGIAFLFLGGSNKIPTKYFAIGYITGMVVFIAGLGLWALVTEAPPAHHHHKICHTVFHNQEVRVLEC